MNHASKAKREWCAMLAKLTSPMEAETATAAFVAMLPLLDFTDDAFNRSTLEAAARREPGDTAIPNFDKIARVLGEWFKARRPSEHHALAAPDTDLPALDAADHSWLAMWNREKEAGFPPKDGTPRYRDVHPDTPSNHRRAHLASLIRNKCPAAWKHIQERSQ